MRHLHRLPGNRVLLAVLLSQAAAVLGVAQNASPLLPPNNLFSSLGTTLLASAPVAKLREMVATHATGSSEENRPYNVTEPVFLQHVSSQHNVTTEVRFPTETIRPALLDTFSSIQPSALLPKARRLRGVEKIRHEIASGETMTEILHLHEVKASAIPKITNAFFEQAESNQPLHTGDTVELLRTSMSGDVLELRKKFVSGGYLLVKREAGGRYERSEIRGVTFERERRVAGTISSSLAASAAELDLPYPIVDEFVDLFSDKIEFRKDVHRGDTFSLIFKEKKDERGRVTEAGPILAASIKSQGKLIVAVRYVGKDGKARHFNEKGKPRGSGFLRYPLAFSRISSVFSSARFHPVLQRFKPHNGVDFAAPVGTPIRNIGDGVVTYAGYNGASGLMVKIRHNDRYTTAYLHLSRLGNGVRQGARIARGQELGRVGMSGRTTGPHLHYSLYDRDKYVDPLKTQLPFMVEEENLIPRSVLIARMRALEEQLHMVAMVTPRAAAS